MIFLSTQGSELQSLEQLPFFELVLSLITQKRCDTVVKWLSMTLIKLFRGWRSFCVAFHFSPSTHDNLELEKPIGSEHIYIVHDRKDMSGEVAYRITPYGSDILASCNKAIYTVMHRQAIYGHWFHLAYHKENKFERYQTCESVFDREPNNIWISQLELPYMLGL